MGSTSDPTNPTPGIRSFALQQATTHDGFIAVETGGGFHGERFVNNLIEAHGGGAVDLDDPDDTAANIEPAVAVIRAPLVAGLRGWSDTVAARHRNRMPTIVVLPPGVSGAALARESTPALVIDAGALMMDSADIGELVSDEGSDGFSSVIATISGGWPDFIDAALQTTSRGSQRNDALLTVTSPQFRDELVGLHLVRFSRDEVEAIGQLAHFESFSLRVAAAIGGVDFADTVLPHAPGLHRIRTGLWCFAEPVRRHLTDLVPLSPDAAEIIAPILAGEGETIAAIDTLMEAGLTKQAAKLLDVLPGPVLDRCNQREMLAVLRMVRQAAPEFASLGLKLARVHGNLYETQQSVEACETVLSYAPVGSPLWLSAASELLWHQHRSIDPDDARHQLDALRETLAVAPDPEAATRLLEVEANVLGQSPDARTVQRSVEMLIEVAEQWERQGEQLRAARALRGAATGPLQHLGRYRQAQTMMARAASLAVQQSFDFGLCLVVKARFDAFCADRDAFTESHEQAKLIIDPTGIGWLQAHLDISAAIDASWDRNSVEINRLFHQSKQLLGPAYDDDNDIMLHADMATLLAFAGDTGSAQKVLDQVRQQSSRNPIEFGIAETIVAARAGDYDKASEVWEHLDSFCDVPADRRWRVMLELELAGGTRLPAIVNSIRYDAAKLDLAQLPRRLGPELFNQPPAGDGVRISTLGTFEIVAGGRSVRLPGKKAAALIRLLIVSDRSCSIDVAAEHLWPDDDRDTGSRRLHNVVTRTRKALGDDTLVRTDGRIQLATNVLLDLDEFTNATGRFDASSAHDPGKALSYATEALNIYRGPLLPGEVYTDRINTTRTALAHDAQRMLAYAERNEASPVWLANAKRRITTSENVEAGNLDEITGTST